jgi:hypothetical protein
MHVVSLALEGQPDQQSQVGLVVHDQDAGRRAQFNLHTAARVRGNT